MQEKAKQIVVDYFNSHVEKTDHKQITLDDVYYFDGSSWNKVGGN